METITGPDQLRDRLAALRRDGRSVGLVPTMGALHEGHLSLVRLAAERADAVVVSVFVNPTQFDAADDLAAYPRDLDGDLRALEGLEARAPAIVFVPGAGDVYPPGAATSVHVERLTETLCGASRPGHFDGVATVVTALLSLVRPDLAVFGRKDFQQLQVIRRLVRDLALGVEVVAAPTVREPDGLALSSRNRRLAHGERAEALAIPRSLRAAVLARRGNAGPQKVRQTALATLTRQRGVRVDYCEVVDPETLAAPADGQPAPARLLVAVAAHVGPVRLIDNVEIGDADDERALLDATG